MSKFTGLKRHLLLPVLAGGILLFFVRLGIGCPIYRLTGFPCPTCGTTRAILALLRLDFHGYLFYQPFAVPMVLVVLLCIHGRLLAGRWRCAAGVFSGAILCANTLRYVALFFL